MMEVKIEFELPKKVDVLPRWRRRAGMAKTAEYCQ
jgi:hypothetical protein